MATGLDGTYARRHASANVSSALVGGWRKWSRASVVLCCTVAAVLLLFGREVFPGRGCRGQNRLQHLRGRRDRNWLDIMKRRRCRSGCRMLSDLCDFSDPFRFSLFLSASALLAASSTRYHIHSNQIFAQSILPSFKPWQKAR